MGFRLRRRTSRHPQELFATTEPTKPYCDFAIRCPCVDITDRGRTDAVVHIEALAPTTATPKRLRTSRCRTFTSDSGTNTATLSHPADTSTCPFTHMREPVSLGTPSRLILGTYSSLTPPRLEGSRLSSLRVDDHTWPCVRRSGLDGLFTTAYGSTLTRR